jgi:hypothetical protein
MQERVESDLTDSFIVHRPLERFIINTHAFHNTHLLRQALPRQLTVPLPLFVDRKAKHFELAVTLRETKEGKRQRAKEKRAAKKKDAEANQATNTTARKTGTKRKKAHQQTVNPLPTASEDDDQPEKSGADDSDSDSENSDSDGERPNKRPRTKKTGDASDLDPDPDSDYHRRGVVEDGPVDEGGLRRSGRSRRLPRRFEDGDLDMDLE